MIRTPLHVGHVIKGIVVEDEERAPLPLQIGHTWYGTHLAIRGDSVNTIPVLFMASKALRQSTSSAPLTGARLICAG